MMIRIRKWWAGVVVALLMGPALAHAQAGPAAQTSEQVFKNVQVLRGISPKELMETMGFFAASLAMNCTDCHGGASASDWANYALETPLKQRARMMVIMVNTINSSNFGSAKKVTCYTCHRGSQKPKVIPSLAAQYAPPADEDPDEIEQFPGTKATMTPEQILDRYIQAVGGAAATAKLTSYTGQGTYEGFDSDFSKVPFEIYAKAPNQRATIAHMAPGDQTTVFDGKDAWVATSLDLYPVPLTQLAGTNLEAALLDAQLAFPGQIKQALTDWQGGFPPVSIDDRPMDVISGKTKNGARIKLFFDKQTGLLTRYTRYTDTMVGTVTTHTSYGDYREIPGTGVKIPFYWEPTWVDGQGQIHLTAVKPNVAIDAAKFGKPTPPKAK